MLAATRRRWHSVSVDHATIASVPYGALVMLTGTLGTTTALPIDAHAHPHVFISHGTRDQILPIDQCSRRIVPQLQRAKYDVQYQEFDGPHAVPPEIAKGAINWMQNG